MGEPHPKATGRSPLRGRRAAHPFPFLRPFDSAQGERNTPPLDSRLGLGMGG